MYCNFDSSLSNIFNLISYSVKSSLRNMSRNGRIAGDDQDGQGVALVVVDMQNDFCEENSPGKPVFS